MKYFGSLNHYYHLAYLRYIVWQRRRDCVQELRKIRQSCNVKALSESQKRDVKEFWGTLTKRRCFDMKWYEAFNAFNTNEEHLKYYIPHDFYYCYVDTAFSNAQRAYVLDDKNMYDYFFYDIQMPKTICRKMGGSYLDGDYHIISCEDALAKCKERSRVIIKETINSSGGSGISFWEAGIDDDDKLEYLLKTNENCIIQDVIEQHEILAKLHRNSVNTIRVMTIIWNNELIPISAILRMGVNKARIDNASNGGIVCGIDESGMLCDIAYDGHNNSFKRHPQGAPFSGVIIPSFSKCKEIACSLAGRFSSVTRLVSWDFAIDKNASPILIEANLTYGGIGVHQKCNGPLFGERTVEILRFVIENHPFLSK